MRILRFAPLSILVLALAAAAPPVHAAARLYIVQAPTAAAARASVLRVHGKLERELPIIHAVAARLDARQAARLRATPAVRLFADRTVATRAAGSLLAGLHARPCSSTVNSADQTLATNPLVSTVTGAANPVVVHGHHRIPWSAP